MICPQCEKDLEPIRDSVNPDEVKEQKKREAFIPIVRCKNCNNCRKTHLYWGYYCEVWNQYTMPNDYCSRGVVKQNDTL